MEPGPGVDVEGLEVAKQCLEQVFKVESPASDELTEFDSLVDIFSSPESFQRPDTNSFVDNGALPMDHHCPLNLNNSDANLSKSPKSQVNFLSLILCNNFHSLIYVYSSIPFVSIKIIGEVYHHWDSSETL